MKGMGGTGWNTDSLKVTCLNDGYQVGDYVAVKFSTHSQTGLKYKITGITDDGYELSRYVTVKPRKPAGNKKPYPVRNWWER